MGVTALASLQADHYLFDRARKTHTWFDALQALASSSGEGHAALADNWRMDWRVDAAREQELEAAGCFPGGASGNGFDAAIREYHQHFNCRQAAASQGAAYAGAANQGNLIPPEQRPSRNHHLLHTASLRRLLGFALRPATPGNFDFRSALYRRWDLRLPDRPAAADVDRLATTLQEKGLEQIKDFAGLLSTALGDNEPNWWAAFVHEIGALSDIDDWAEVVRKTGQGGIDKGEWLLAWRYSPELAGRLYRPTVADAAAYAFHFPSPPLATLGVVMPLQAGLPAIRELIHAPLKGQTSIDACIGFGRVLTDPAPLQGAKQVNQWFQTRRRQHGEHLVGAQPAHNPTRAWLQRHAILP